MSPAGGALTPISPYRGFLPFRYADRNWFFGREQEIQDLAAKSVLYRLVVLFGGSGSGKSSLLNAGLFPALRREGFQPERLRVRPFEDEPILVERIAAPDEPLGFLPSLFDGGKEGRPESFYSIEEFRDRIDRRVSSTARVPVLIFDQFEEMFTVVEPASRALFDHVLKTIIELINSDVLKAKFILSLREDFLGHLEIIAKGCPQIFDRRIRLRQLERKAAQSAIRGPFEEPHKWPAVIGGDAAEAILDDFLQGNPDATVHTTHLQIVCSRLWDRFASAGVITAGHFRQAGGVQGLLEGFLESELAQLSEEDRAHAYQLLGQLVTASGTRDVVGEERLLSQLGDDAKSGWLKSVSRFLEERHLVNRIRQRGTSYLEIGSEYLIAPVTRRNLAAAREVAAREAAADAIEREKEVGRQRELEQTRLWAVAEKRMNRWLVGLAALLVLALVLAVAQLVRANKLGFKNVEVNNALTLSNEKLREAVEALRQNNVDLERGRTALTESNIDLQRQTLIAESANAQLSREKLEIERLRRLENAIRLSVQADAARESNPLLAARLATEAILHHHFPQSDLAARRSIVSLESQLGRLASEPPRYAFCPNGTCAVFTLPGRIALRLQSPVPPHSVMVLSPDGRYSAMAKGRSVMVWETPVGRQIAAFETKADVQDLRFSADATYLGTVESSELTVWNVGSGQSQRRLPLVSAQRLLSLSTDGRIATVQTGSSNQPGQLQVWDVALSKPTLRIAADGLGSALAVSPDGQRLFSSTNESGEIRNTLTGDALFRAVPLRTVRAAAFAPDNRFLAVLGSDHQLAIWDLSRQTEILHLTISPELTHETNLARGEPTLSFTPDGKFIAVVWGLATEAYLYRTPDLVKSLCTLLDRPLSREEWSDYLREEFRDPCAQLK